MKRLLRSVPALFLVLALVCGSVLAAGSVPAPVLKSARSVVRVFSEYKNGWATGSGFVISNTKSEILIATNFHVVEDSPAAVYIWTEGNNDLTPVTIVASSENQDLCILRLSGSYQFRALTLTNTASQGDEIFAVGFPSAADVLSDEAAHTSADVTITNGIISAVRSLTLTESGSPLTLYQISAAINSGNSGGPLMNAKGQVIGINTYGVRDAEGVNGAISAAELQSLANSYHIQLHRSSFGLLAAVGGGLALMAVVWAALRLISRRRDKAGKMTLRAYLAQLPQGLTAEQAVSLLIPVALQLRKMHQDGAPHLQVSPDTVSIVKGKAVLTPPAAGENNRYSSGFAAPEIYSGRSQGQLSDIYSFCALLQFSQTGIVPENALSRAEHPEEAPVDEFAALVSRGMSLDPAQRFSSMQALILQLTPYNTSPALPGAQAVPAPKKKRKPLSGPKKAALTFAVLAVLLTAAAGSYWYTYTQAIDLANAGDFGTAQTYLFVPQITRLHDPVLEEYIEAGLMLNRKQYVEAENSFRKIAPYQNSLYFINESMYQHGLAYLSTGDYSNSIKVFSSLANIGYKNSKEKGIDGYLLLINDLYQGGPDNQHNLVMALNAYHELEIFSNKNVDDVKEKIYSSIYSLAEKKYKEKQFPVAKSLFERIGDYKDSSKYINLCELSWQYGKDIEEYYLSALQNIHFADTKKVLVRSIWVAERFLTGTWKSLNGEYYFKMVDDTEHSVSFNLPAFSSTKPSYIIGEGVFSLFSGLGSTRYFKFTIVDADTINVYCFQNKKTYTLYRQ